MIRKIILTLLCVVFLFSTAFAQSETDTKSRKKIKMSAIHEEQLEHLAEELEQLHAELPSLVCLPSLESLPHLEVLPQIHETLALEMSHLNDELAALDDMHIDLSRELDHMNIELDHMNLDLSHMDIDLSHLDHIDIPPIPPIPPIDLDFIEPMLTHLDFPMYVDFEYGDFRFSENDELTEKEELQLATIKSISRKNERKALSAIEKQLSSSDNPAMRYYLVKLASRLDDEDVVPLLIDVAKHDKDIEVRKAAIRCLGRTDDERAVAALQEIVSE